MNQAQQNYLEGLLNAYADTVREEHDTRTSSPRYGAISNAMDCAQEGIILWIGEGMPLPGPDDID